jgi:hypothetical protein
MNDKWRGTRVGTARYAHSVLPSAMRSREHIPPLAFPVPAERVLAIGGVCA